MGKCKTPTLCPKPKCQLTCEQPGCSEEKEFGPPGGNSPCCPCNAGNTAFAVQHAEIHARKNGISGPKASFLEVLHGFSHQAQQGKAPCCPCASPKYISVYLQKFQPPLSFQSRKSGSTVL